MFLNVEHFSLSILKTKMLVIKAGIHKMSEKQTGKTLIRLLLKKSDLGLHYLSMRFWQATCVQNYRKLIQESHNSVHLKV